MAMVMAMVGGMGFLHYNMTVNPSGLVVKLPASKWLF
jgi:hypothetical protein